MTGERGAGCREMTENAEGKSSVLMERRPAREDEGVAGKKMISKDGEGGNGDDL